MTSNPTRIRPASDSSEDHRDQPRVEHAVVRKVDHFYGGNYSDARVAILSLALPATVVVDRRGSCASDDCDVRRVMFVEQAGLDQEAIDGVRTAFLNIMVRALSSSGVDLADSGCVASALVAAGVPSSAIAELGTVAARIAEARRSKAPPPLRPLLN